MKRWFAGIFIFVVSFSSYDQQKRPQEQERLKKAIEKGFEYLIKRQHKDGSWGDNFKTAITAIASLAILASQEDPFDSKYTDAMLKGYRYLMKVQKDGCFPKERHSWIHVHGFATLFLSELYGKAILRKKRPKLNIKRLRRTIEKAVHLIEKAQTPEGGWYYTKNPGPQQHENSTTVCAVQALRSAANYGIKINKKVLEKGFKYLKRCQNKDGSFRYRLSPSRAMAPGSAGALSTLVLMRKLDYDVLLNGLEYLKRIKTSGISRSSWPYYGHFYGVMAMKIIHDEYGKHQPEAGRWYSMVKDEYLRNQRKDGSWPPRGWGIRNIRNPHIYSTAFALLTLVVPKGNLSIFHRDPPKLPEEKK